MPPLARQLPPEPTTISRSHTVSRRAPKLAANKTFTFWRRVQSQKRKRVLTVGDHLVQTKKRKQHRREYQDALEEAHATIRELAEGLRNRFRKYSVDHYYSDLIHRAHTSRSVRKVNCWNAYQKLELERMKCEAGENASQINLTEVNKQISESWKALSPAQRKDVTADSIQQIEEQREGKKLAVHSVPLNAFHDARSTIRSIETQLAQLHSRTGLEFLFVACRSAVEHFIKPYAYFSSDTVERFFGSTLNRSVEDFALQLESFVMSGIKGVVENSKTQTLDLKKRLAALIMEKLRATTGTTNLHMQYNRFDDLITLKHSVVRNMVFLNFL
ncbi:hypothetical protein BJ322DRAFT_1104974 [Thelephora terrestris]|uniref:Uncharacterized protein n=1 Tax=Thelephora terrestris TaxID=56493 RepID=A0A9P6HNH8_9AGAM|nr:hypothetical protein BJ322DRAFT_1104974 [Thelephora terrestris]